MLGQASRKKRHINQIQGGYDDLELDDEYTGRASCTKWLFCVAPEAQCGYASIEPYGSIRAVLQAVRIK